MNLAVADIGHRAEAARAGPLHVPVDLLARLRIVVAQDMSRDQQRGQTLRRNHPVDQVIDKIEPDIIIEGTGATPVIKAALANPKPYAITVLTGISDEGKEETVDLGTINRTAVLGNAAIVGSVNANLRHYEAAAEALAAADHAWLERLVTRRVPLEKFADAFAPQPHDVKIVLTI